MSETINVSVSGGQVSVVVSGERSDECVLLHPSLRRWARDLDHLVAALVEASFCTIAIDPRGVASSAASSDGVDMRTLVGDVVEVRRSLGIGRAHLVGHAFGNRVVRSVATLHRELVITVTLLGAGGRVAGDDEARAALPRCFDATLPAADRRRRRHNTLSVPLCLRAAHRHVDDARPTGLRVVHTRAHHRRRGNTPPRPTGSSGHALRPVTGNVSPRYAKSRCTSRGRDSTS